MTQLTPKELDQIIRQYEPLVHHCLQKAHIHWSANDYQDYQQIATLSLVEASKTCDCYPLSDKPYAFIAYAKRRMLWKIRDAQRHRYSQQDHEQIVEIIPDQIDSHQDRNRENAWLDQAFISLLKAGLSDEELHFLVILLEEDLSQSEKARQLGISRKTFYYRRKRLGAKVRNILEAAGDK